MSELLEAALAYAGRGWPVLACARKIPRTRHGVRDASTDPDVIRKWWETWPLADVGVATGAPGPQVVDVDTPRAVPDLVAALDVTEAARSATARGLHFWFAGVDAGTVAHDWGEVRGRGSYVVAPPSQHPEGRAYVWLQEPNGTLPALPKALRTTSGTAGRGEHHAPAARLPHGQRHPYLKDFAVRLVRAGVTDEQRLLAHLRAEFDLSCEPDPVPPPGALEALARWGAGTAIAQRERAAADGEWTLCVRRSR